MRQNQKAFSLIELLIGMVVSLIVMMAVFMSVKITSQAARRANDDETVWHAARISLLAIGENIQNAGYLINLSAPGAQSPALIQNSPTSNYTAPGGFVNQGLTLVDNISGNPGTQQLDTWNWTLATSAQTGNPSLIASESGVNSAVYEYADGVVAMRFQQSCHSDPSTYYKNGQACPGGVSDARSVQVAMLVRDLMPSQSNRVVATQFSFPDGSIYTVPANGGVGCINGDCTRYRHRLFVIEFPLRNLAWGL